MQPYSPRPIFLLDPIAHRDWVLKQYSIVFGDASFDQKRFRDVDTVMRGRADGRAAYLEHSLARL